MARMLRVGCLCALPLALPLQDTRAAAESANAAGDAQAVEAWLNSYSSSINKGDLEAFGRLWTDGTDWAPPDAPLRSGRDAIVGSARAMFEKYTASQRFTAQAFKVVEDFGVAVIAAAEGYSPKVGGGAPWEQNVKGVIILRRDGDGIWRGTHFIWNRNAPAEH